MNNSIKTLTFAALAALSLGAQAKVNAGQAYGDWKGVCNDGECGIAQTVNNDKNQPVGQVMIRKVAEADNKTIMFITVPLGVNLRAGMALAVDGKELGVIPFDFCVEGGCNAAVPLEGDALAKIKGGNALQVAAFVLDKQQTMSFSLSGVTNGINSL